MCEISVPKVISALENVLHDILIIAPTTRRGRFTAKFIESLSPAGDIGLNRRISTLPTFVSLFVADVDHICYPERIGIAVLVWTYKPAELADNKQQR